MQILLRHLRQARKNAGLTQQELADCLGQHQSFVSKYEVGERRLDVLELFEVCHCMGIDAQEFVKQLQEAIEGDTG